MSEKFYRLGCLEIERCRDAADLFAVRSFTGGFIDGHARCEKRMAHLDLVNDLLWVEPTSIDTTTDRFSSDFEVGVWFVGLPPWSLTSYALEFDHLSGRPSVIKTGPPPTRELAEWELRTMSWRISRALRSVANQLLAGEFDGSDIFTKARITTMLRYSSPDSEICREALRLLA